MFESSVVPGWYNVVYPPYYIAGLLLSTLAIVYLIGIIIVKLLRVQENKYLDVMNGLNWVVCILGSILLAVYLFELFMAWFSGSIKEQFAFHQRAAGPYFITYFVVLLFPLLSTQVFWIKKYRVSLKFTVFLLFILNLSFWFERLSIIFMTLTR